MAANFQLGGNAVTPHPPGTSVGQMAQAPRCQDKDADNSMVTNQEATSVTVHYLAFFIIYMFYII